MSETPASLSGREGSPRSSPEPESSPHTPVSHSQTPEATIMKMEAEATAPTGSRFETALSTQALLRPTSVELDSPVSNTWAPHGLPPPDPFRRPIPGQIRLVNAIMPEGGARTQFPAVFSVLPDGTPILFAFSRARLGLTYYGETQVQAGQYTALASGDPSAALGVAADLPPGLMAAITVSISTIERAP